MIQYFPKKLRSRISEWEEGWNTAEFRISEDHQLVVFYWSCLMNWEYLCALHAKQNFWWFPWLSAAILVNLPGNIGKAHTSDAFLMYLWVRRECSCRLRAGGFSALLRFLQLHMRNWSFGDLLVAAICKILSGTADSRASQNFFSRIGHLIADSSVGCSTKPEWCVVQQKLIQWVRR